VPSRPDEDLPRSPALADLQKPLDTFRAKTKRLRVHPLEKAALWVISANLVFLPWALGGMRLWAQIISLAFSVASLTIALLPRFYTEEHTGSNRFRLVMWPKLWKFPIFWLGLALLGYVVIQGLNPAWVYDTDGVGWWVDERDHITWLPAGVSAPLARGGPWAALIVYTSAWLTVCSIWVAFTRRRTVQRLIMVLAFNGLLLAALGVAQRFLESRKIFWFFESPNPMFFSSFIYKNHGGAYLNLMLVVTCGLAAWYYMRGLRRLEKSNPSGVLAFFTICIAVSVITSYARGATLVMLVFLLVCIGAFIVHQVFIPSGNRKPFVAFVLVLIFGFFLTTGFDALRSGVAWDRMQQGLTRKDGSLDIRERATAASLEMLRNHWITGVGASSYQFVFPTYQHRYPELVATNGNRKFWEHAHNDIVQFPIELGCIGVGFILLVGGYWTLALTRSYFWENPFAACAVFGLLLSLAYAWWDFPFQCPAIMITWSALWSAITRWTEFEEQSVKG
jgi:hypothetical protein